MFFGLMKIIGSEGAILAHSLRLANLIIRKGTKLSKEHIDALHKLGVKELVCAKLDQNDVNEEATSTAVDNFTSQGFLETVQETIVAVRNARVITQNISDTRTTSRTTTI